MPAVTARRWRCLALVALQLCLLLPSLPVKAASALAAWALTENGTLQLRTSRNARLQALQDKRSRARHAREAAQLKLAFIQRLAKQPAEGEQGL